MPYGLENLQVLLVDDNDQVRTIVATMLIGAGVKNVIETFDGAEALKILARRPVDIAIVDFLMRPIGGVEFTQSVRTGPNSPNPYLPIVMMTGHSERTHVMQARDAGVTEFLVKPLTAQALLSRLQAVIYKPRAFVRAPHYFGPDRRRRAEPNFAGPWRRLSDGRPATPKGGKDEQYI